MEENLTQLHRKEARGIMTSAQKEPSK